MKRSAASLPRAFVIGLALALLIAVFAAYLDPQLMLTLANQVWSCL